MIFDWLVKSKYQDGFWGDIENFGQFWPILGQFQGNRGRQYIDIDLSSISRDGGYLDIDISSILTKISKYSPLIWVGRNIGHPYGRLSKCYKIYTSIISDPKLYP